MQDFIVIYLASYSETYKSSELLLFLSQIHEWRRMVNKVLKEDVLDDDFEEENNKKDNFISNDLKGNSKAVYTLQD